MGMRRVLMASAGTVVGLTAAAVQAQPVSPSDLALAQVRATAFHYRGFATGTGGPAPILLGLDAPGSGVLTGYAVLLSADGSVEASGPVSGTIAAPYCWFGVTLGTASVQVAGNCSPELIQGSLTERLPRSGLARLAWPDAGTTTGRAWLTQDDSPLP
jgi:hypothetical protein